MSAVLTPPEEATRPEDQEATTADRPARASAWVAVAAVLLALVLAPPSGDGFGAGEFGRLVAGELDLQVSGDWRPLDVGAVVPDGATVRTTDGTADLEVRGGSLSLARWTEASFDGTDLDLGRGEVLVEAERSYTVQFGAVAGTGRGSWRVSTAGVTRFAVYDGGVEVRPPGTTEPIGVARYREAPVAEGTPGAVRPLRYLPSDGWDARLLAEAIRIDRLLAATRRGLVTRYGTQPQSRAFYGDFARFRQLLDELPALAVVREGDRFGPPAETLVAMIVADLLVARTGLSPDEAARDIDRLRAAGAEWGIILREHGLVAGDLDAGIERAVRQRGEAVADGTAAPVRQPPPPQRTIEPAPPPPPPTPEDPDPTDPPVTPPPDPPDDGDDGDEPDTFDPVTDPVTETVDDLGSLLEEVVPGASEVTDTVNDVVEEGTDAVDDLLP